MNKMHSDKHSSGISKGTFNSMAHQQFPTKAQMQEAENNSAVAT